MAGLASGAEAARAAAPAAATTFEALAADAGTPVDFATLMLPFVEDCKDARREIDRARCRGVRSTLRQTLPTRPMRTIVDQPGLVSLTDYDARVKGFKLIVSGCLACKEPVRVGKSGERRFVTLAAPSHEADDLASSVEVARASLTFDDVAASRAWAESVGPTLRAEFVFAPEGTEWSFGPARGFAWKPLAVRVFNHCTGEVVYSKPASTGPAAKYHSGDCERGAPGEVVSGATDAEIAQLSPTDINAGIGAVRKDMEACASRVAFTATAKLNYVVPGISGVPSSVTLSGPLGGTPAGDCVLEAARKARFAKFRGAEQKFTYPVRLQKP